ncbi:hypothetical protein B9Z55_028753 [Caenorhabditis nigoni]|nr:hypothetical protein B9Z55_028753 [Caenorhabditis nigoni]
MVKSVERIALIWFVRATMDHEEAAEEYATFLFDTAMAIFLAGSILGGFVIQPAAEHLGRKKAYMVGVVTYIIACGITILAKEYLSYSLFAASRFISGFGIAILMGLSAITTIECSYINQVNDLHLPIGGVNYRPLSARNKTVKELVTRHVYYPALEIMEPTIDNVGRTNLRTNLGISTQRR